MSQEAKAGSDANPLSGMNPRIASVEDLDGLVATLTAAFASDPLWSWAFPEPQALSAWWRLLVNSALRYDSVWTVDRHAAAAVWIPPGGIELTPEEEELVEPLLDELAGPRAPQILELLTRFESTHPEGPPHHYLSLLGIGPEHRGKGIGMALLAHNLARVDAEGTPAYLESSNPANDARYERLGFRRVGEFNRPDEELTVSTMWREPRAD